jgi:hypothetical protein
MKEVPLLSEFAGLTSWSADIGARVAAAFGFSKPRNQEKTTLMQRTLFSAIENYDGVANSRLLSLSKKNELEMLPGFAGSGHDELTIDYVKQIPAYFTAIAWGVDQVAGTSLAGIGMCPSTFYNSHTDNGNTVVCLSPMAFVSQFFSLWRGSIILKFKLVKTEFHSGRLMISYIPYDPRLAAPSYTVSQYPYLFRTLVDIREGNEFTLTFPYLTIPQYLDTGNVNASQNTMGSVQITVLDPLVAPATVASSISIIIEAYGGPDLEFAQPFQFLYGPYSPTAAQSAPFVPDPCILDSEVIGGCDVTFSDVHSRTCIGERITSFRQLLKVGTSIAHSPYDNTSTNNEALFWPWFSSWVDGAGTAGTPVLPTERVDYYSIIGSCYLLARGSIDLSIDMSVDVKYKSRIVYQPPTTIQSWNTFFTNDADASSQIQWSRHNIVVDNTALSGGIYVRVPYYNRFHSFPVSDSIFWNPTLNPNNNQSHIPLINAAIWTPNGVGTVWSPLRSVADDFSFGGFISVPPMYNFGT